jgi:hypothetical protein
MIRAAFAAPALIAALVSAGAPGVAGAHAKVAGIEHAQLLGALTLRGQLFHVQGVDLDSRHVWVTSVDSRRQRGYLQAFDRVTGAFVRRLDLTDGPRYHPGGFSITNHAIWVPVAEYKPDSSTVLEEIDPDTLTIRRKIAVADHLGCVAATDTSLVAGNWDSRRLYVIDLADPAHMRVVRNPSSTRYQDMKFIDGQLVASGYRSVHNGTIDWIDFPAMTLVRTLHAGATPHGSKLSTRARAFTSEGMALDGHDLYVLPGIGHTRLFHFRLDDSVDTKVR